MDFKLKDVLEADESFVTGTFANIIPVKKINSTSFSLKNNKVTKIKRVVHRANGKVMIIFMWSGPRNLSTAVNAFF